MPALGLTDTREVQYVILEVALPGRPKVNAGVLLLDPAVDKAYVKFRSDWDEVEDEADRLLLESLGEDLQLKSEELAGEKFLRYFEDTLSNVLRITSRRRAECRHPVFTVNRLFNEHVLGRERAQVLPFRSHLPVYSLRAAATKFGEDMEVAEEGWVQAPAGLRLSQDHFVARVVGRSMEPRIPDGSLCVFRANVTGTRQGKLLLIRRKGASESGGEFTIKRYKSEKRSTEEGWEHSRIHLEPLNPEFQPWDLGPEEFTVLGEFVAVLPDDSEIEPAPPA